MKPKTVPVWCCSLGKGGTELPSSPWCSRDTEWGLFQVSGALEMANISVNDFPPIRHFMSGTEEPIPALRLPQNMSKAKRKELGQLWTAVCVTVLCRHYFGVWTQLQTALSPSHTSAFCWNVTQWHYSFCISSIFILQFETDISGTQI